MSIRVAVLLPVYIGDTAKFLSVSIRSLLRQTQKVEIFLIKDGPVCSSVESIIEKYSACLNVITIESNVGLARALNVAINQIPLSRFDFIARMDADDFSVKNRISHQINYMQKKGLDVCGSNYIMFNDINRARIPVKMPLNLSDMRKSILLMSPVCHPSVVFRASVLCENQYPEDTFFQEDYRFWVNLIHDGYSFGNTPEQLIFFRFSQSTIQRRANYKKILFDIPERCYALKVYSGNKFVGFSAVIGRSLTMFFLSKQYILLLKIRNVYHSWFYGR